MPAMCGTLCNCHCLNCRQGEGRVVIHQFQFKVDFILYWNPTQHLSCQECLPAVKACVRLTGHDIGRLRAHSAAPVRA